MPVQNSVRDLTSWGELKGRWETFCAFYQILHFCEQILSFVLESQSADNGEERGSI